MLKESSYVWVLPMNKKINDWCKFLNEIFYYFCEKSVHNLKIKFRFLLNVFFYNEILSKKKPLKCQEGICLSWRGTEKYVLYLRECNTKKFKNK